MIRVGQRTWGLLAHFLACLIGYQVNTLYAAEIGQIPLLELDSYRLLATRISINQLVDVELPTRQLALDTSDLRVPAFTGSLAMRRLYLSQNTADGPLGRGWRFGDLPYLARAAGQNLKLKTNWGTIEYRRRAEHVYQADNGSQIVRTADGYHLGACRT